MIEKDIWQRFKDKGLRILAIGAKEDSEQASSWSSQYSLTYPVMSDPGGDIYKKFGTGSVPFHVLVDKDFLMRLSQEEFEKDSYIKLIEELRDLGI